MMKSIMFFLSFGFILSCNTTKPDVASTSFLNDRIEIDLVDTMKPQRLEGSFSSLGLKLVCIKDVNRKICVYSFDKSKKSLSEMLTLLDGEVGVQAVSKTKGC